MKRKLPQNKTNRKKQSIFQIPNKLSTCGKSVNIENKEFVALVQTLNNFLPSISFESNRYICFDNLFCDKFNLKPIHVNEYITYKNFVDLLSSATSDQIELAGLYPIGNNPNAVHYYVVIPTSYINNRKDFIDWFSSRGALHSFTQNKTFVENALKHPFVILNGYIKGMSPLDTYFKNEVGIFSLGANIQPSQALCAFNALTLGLAFGLPVYRPFIASWALETCFKLKSGLFQRKMYTYNERVVLMFLYEVLYVTTSGTFEPEKSFLVSLTSSEVGFTSKYKLEQAKKLLNKLKKYSFSIVTKKGVNMLSILKIVLSSQNTNQFNYWSQSD